MPRTDFRNKPFGQMPDGRAATLFTLAGEVSFSFTNYGGAIVSIEAPDKAGTRADVALGYETVEQYLKGRAHFGVLVGRFANRIARGRFTLDGHEYQLPLNNGGNHLHGGPLGFGTKLFEAKASETGSPSVTLSLVSHDGEEGYPGNLHLDVTYALADPRTLSIHYRSTTDRPTPVNFTNHSYFNLAGHNAGLILDHELTLSADKMTRIDAQLIPTGELLSVEGTPFDFRKPHRIGERIDVDDEQIRRGLGYDHNFVLPHPNSKEPVLAARVLEPRSGRVLEVLTTEPGIQFYSGNMLTGEEVGKGGAVYARRNGFCLETQHFPDSPNHPNFPNCILRPGEVYESTTLYRFTTA